MKTQDVRVIYTENGEIKEAIMPVSEFGEFTSKQPTAKAYGLYINSEQARSQYTNK